MKEVIKKVCLHMQDIKEKSRRAKARWQILASALRKSHTINDHSIRRFQGYDLFIKKDLTNGWCEFKLQSLTQSSPVSLKLLDNKTTAEELIGFNNTGNICIWPSEEVLAYYCISNKDMFREKIVCELGGGMTSLAGLLLAANVNLEHMLLSDGNEDSCKNLMMIVEENKETIPTKNICAKQILWGEDVKELEKRFDFIICADCLFFVECHEVLVKTIISLLRSNGECIIFAPNRGETLRKFVSIAEKHFKITVSEDYDDHITQLHHKFKNRDNLYSPDIHYPLLLKLKFV